MNATSTPPKGRVAYSLALRALPGWQHPPEQRLRAALKVLLRRFGLRCTECREQNLIKAMPGVQFELHDDGEQMNHKTKGESEL